VRETANPSGKSLLGYKARLRLDKTSAAGAFTKTTPDKAPNDAPITTKGLDLSIVVETAPGAGIADAAPIMVAFGRPVCWS